jgi:phosphohistidine phosphatase
MPRKGSDKMKRLILLRHAKSSWSDPEQDDADRPLNERGRLAAPLVGAWIAERAGTPDQVVISYARRAVETWQGVRRQFDDPPVPVVDRRLYMADPATMLDVLREVPAAARTVLMIGHQPGLSSFVRKLAGSGAPAHCAEAFGRFPTASAAILEFEDGDWSATDWGAGAFRHFAVPKDLV